jgi:penicillin-insensitive murein endopeptidase
MNRCMSSLFSCMSLGSCALTACLATGCWSAPAAIAPHVGGSVGLPHDGTLTDAAALGQRGSGYARMRSDAIRYANPRLVGAITRAAERVARERPGADVFVADLSAQHGGRIARHRSHRTGRDADLLFYARTPDGRSVDNDGFFHFGADGIATIDEQKRQYVMIDVERTWLLVESLVRDEDAQIQWLFVARWLDAMLIEHAKAVGADEELVRRAQHVLRQPSDSLAHDDHIHVRIACTPAEAARGCRGGGRPWPWHEQASPADLGDETLIGLLIGDLEPT